jgi:predicted glycosyltransferase
MVGSGGTACRETALCGIPTINFHCWDVQAQYLGKKKFPIQIIRNTNHIITTAKKLLTKPQKIDTQAALNKLETPIPTWLKYIKICLQKQK